MQDLKNKHITHIVIPEEKKPGLSPKPSLNFKLTKYKKS
jgi:hypothetical protein